jgi:hypothetical protein
MRKVLLGATGVVLLACASAPTADAQLTSGVYTGEQVMLQPVQLYDWGGRHYCWYVDGWHGPGWYWCGFRFREGFGWGGGYGWHGWGGGFRNGYRGGFRGGAGFHGGGHGGGGHGGGGHGGGGHGGGHGGHR